MPSLPDDLDPVWNRFVAQPGVLRRAVAGADGGLLGRMVPESDWTVRDEVIALAEFEQVFGVQLRLVIAQEEPALPRYDMQAWKRRLHYIWRDPEAALALFEALRWSNAELLENVRAEGWDRLGMLGERETTLAELFVAATAHVAARTDRIRRVVGPGPDGADVS